MSRKSEIFESVLTSAYDNNAFVGFVQELLNNVELVAPNAYKKVYNNFSYYVDGYYHIGNYTGNDGGKIAIFSVALKKGDSVEQLCKTTSGKRNVCWCIGSVLYARRT